MFAYTSIKRSLHTLIEWSKMSSGLFNFFIHATHYDLHILKLMYI